MFSILTTIALNLLPMGASVTLADSGQCATSDHAPLTVCTDYNSDTIVIQYGDRLYRGTSSDLRELAENI